MNPPVLLGDVAFAWLEFFVRMSVYIGVLHLVRWFAWGRFGAR